MIEIDGQHYVPAAFRSFRPTPANVSLFQRADVKLYQMLCTGLDSTLRIPYSLYGGIWVGDDAYDFTAFDNQMEMFVKYAPDGYIMVMIQLDMPVWWRENNPDVCDSYYGFGNAVLSEKWKSDAERYLEAFIKYAEGKYQDRIFGYSFSGGLATEWFDNSFAIADANKENAYKSYLNDPSAKAPTKEELAELGESVFRKPDSNEAKYLNYSCDLTADTICRFARAAQKILQKRKLLGIFYGYIICDSFRQNLWTINGYEKVWASDDLDMIFSPAAYNEHRELEGVSGYQVLVDSIELHDKLYLHEIDHRTHLAYYPLESGNFLNDCYKTEYETLMVLRRELCAACMKGSALWWFDFFGGYYASPALEEEIKKHMSIMNRLYALPRKQLAQIAVFADPRSFLLLKESANIHHKYVRYNFNALGECGAPYECFNLKDIDLVDTDKYRMFVFLNPFDISDKIKKTIKQKLKGKMKVWIHAPNISDNKLSDEAAVTEITGIKVRKFESDREEFLEFKGERFGFGKKVNPIFEVMDNESEIIAQFCGCEKNGLALKGDNVYCSVGNLTSSLWRHLAELAGVHIYCSTGGSLYMDSRFIAKHNNFDGQCTITMPYDCEFEELFDGGLYKTKNKKLTYTSEKGRMKMFLIKKIL